ncbi:uncharacterized protein VTP21DRAFT_3821 [Calcarisporiella thermophila]|uniref:uncharacterized protein n=1 Tax=Calcarisporiella thermophila TaxID=911321 RepID=UPI003744A0A1
MSTSTDWNAILNQQFGTPVKSEDELASALDQLSIAAPEPPKQEQQSREQEEEEPTTYVVMQPGCTRHRFIRNMKELIFVVERPERVRAVQCGVAAAVVRVEEHHQTAIGIRHSTRLLPLADPLLARVHSSAHLKNVQDWSAQSIDALSERGCELPPECPTGDLYVCPDTRHAIEAALGCVADAVDTVTRGEGRRAFAVLRPPGHHCEHETAMGFCFVNNVMAGIHYAHERYGVNRAVIFDIDLHHGNGTQDIVWKSNKIQANLHGDKGLKIFYGSLHDILSYPCESGDDECIQAASLCLMSHSQYIWNVHLEPWKSLAHHDQLYSERYAVLFEKAREFLEKTRNGTERVLVWISCGMDACEHEHESMQRHGRSVPTEFYHRFAQDAAKLAREAGAGLVSVLEGGYRDRALVAGALAHVSGLALSGKDMKREDESAVKQWWELKELEQIEATLLKGEKISSGFLTRCACILGAIEAENTKYLAANSLLTPTHLPGRNRRVKDKEPVRRSPRARG